MRKLFQRLKGTVRTEICGAFPEAVLNACAMNAVLLWDLTCVDEYSIHVTVYENQLEDLKAAAERSMCQLKVLSQKGGSRERRLLGKRLWLLISALVVTGLLCLSSLFIWEIEIRGCESLSSGQVLRALSDCGVERGTYWPGLSSDLVRSQMLSLLPELAWMTVNVSGSRALVLVSEREEKPEIYLESRGRDIIAGKTGIITQMQVLNGTALVSVGQAVLKGETLVSGLVESLSNPPRIICSQASVIADTWYELCAVCPLEQELKTDEKLSWQRFAIKIGKKRINFYFGSGKLIDECDKIVEEYNLGIEGLFALPVSLVKEKLCRWELESGQAEMEQAMKDGLYSYLLEQIDGEIVTSNYTVTSSQGLMYVCLRAQCRENIAVNMDITQVGDSSRLPTVKGF